MVQIETRPSAGRTNIGPARKFWIESDLVYPLAKGASNIGKGLFLYDANLCAILPNVGISASDYKKAEEVLDDLPKTKEYFQTYKEKLLQRSTFRKFMPGAPFWAVYNVGAYTLIQYKVAWSEIGNTVKAAILEVDAQENPLKNQIVIPDHKLFFSAFSSRDEATFVTGILNSTVITDVISKSTVSTSRGNILKNLKLPRFDSKNKEHLQLIKALNENSYKTMQSEIDTLCLKILSK